MDEGQEAGAYEHRDDGGMGPEVGFAGGEVTSLLPQKEEYWQEFVE